jgi:hypothetical protein
VCQDRVAVVQRPPQVLSPPADRLHPVTVRDCLEVHRSAGVSANSAVVEDLDPGNAATNKMRGQAAPNGLDLG